MSAEREIPKSPDKFTVLTGEQDKIEEAKDKFFNSILDYLELNEQARNAFVRSKTLYLYPHPTGKDRDILSTIEGVHTLTFNDRLLASVLQATDDYNRLQVGFASYLDEPTVRRVREFVKNYS